MTLSSADSGETHAGGHPSKATMTDLGFLTAGAGQALNWRQLKVSIKQRFLHIEGTETIAILNQFSSVSIHFLP